MFAVNHLLRVFRPEMNPFANNSGNLMKNRRLLKSLIKFQLVSDVLPLFVFELVFTPPPKKKKNSTGKIQWETSELITLEPINVGSMGEGKQSGQVWGGESVE